MSNEQQLFTGIHTQILTYPPKCEQYSTRLKQVCLLAVACKNSISVLLFVESDLWSLLTHLYCRKKDHSRYSISLISNFLVFGLCSCSFFWFFTTCVIVKHGEGLHRCWDTAGRRQQWQDFPPSNIFFFAFSFYPTFGLIFSGSFSFIILLCF